MKKVIFSIVMFTLAFATVKAQDAAIPVNPNGPDIQFVKTVHDYGTIIQGADGNCDFKFKNTGKEPLILSNVVSSCGCTVPSWTRDPIMPGKEGTIKVKYDTNRIGMIGKQITVMSNAKTERVVLQITGKIEPKPTEQMPEKTVTPGTTPAPISH
ncbi:MAG: DUF1573 domain-containing protein [Bacteroidetes bacterium]|nr:DUF1573 domain-containing protein [Bacteroidota bacterium]